MSDLVPIANGMNGTPAAMPWGASPPATVQRSGGVSPLPPRPPRSVEPLRGSHPADLQALARQQEHAPAARPTSAPRGSTFSTRTKAAMTATQRRFITPATKSRAIRTQQHPTQ